MKEVIVTVTQRSQVTIPAAVRRALGIKPRDKVAFEIEDDQVRLVPAKFTLESAYGSVKPISTPENFEEISRSVKEEHADEAVRRMQRR